MAEEGLNEQQLREGTWNAVVWYPQRKAGNLTGSTKLQVEGSWIS